MSKARVFAVLVIGLIVIAALAVFFIPRGPSYAVTGYDGPVAGFESIDHNLDYYYHENYRDYVGTTSAYVHPESPDAFDLMVATGLRAEIQAVPNILSQEPEDTVSRSVVDEEAETNTTTTVQIWRAKCEMMVVVTTYEGGLAEVKDVIFWVELEDNADSIFSSAQDRYAYFVEVYTTELVSKEGSITVVPTMKASSFDTEPTTTEEVPDWLLDAGYTTAAEEMTAVRFPIEVLSAVPIYAWGVRSESDATFMIGFDVILTAKWVHIADYKEAAWPDLPDWFGDLLDAIARFLWLILGIIGTIIVVMKVKDPRYVVLVLGIIWGIALWQMGVLESIFGALGI